MLLLLLLATHRSQARAVRAPRGLGPRSVNSHPEKKRMTQPGFEPDTFGFLGRLASANGAIEFREFHLVHTRVTCHADDIRRIVRLNVCMLKPRDVHVMWANRHSIREIGVHLHVESAVMSLIRKLEHVTAETDTASTAHDWRWLCRRRVYRVTGVTGPTRYLL